MRTTALRIYATLMLGLSFWLLTAKAIANPNSFRRFQDNQGREMIATVLSTQGDKFVIKLKNGRKFEVELSLFCKEDQLYLQNWASQQIGPNITSEQFDISIKRKRGKATKKDEGSHDVKEWTEWFEITLQNKSNNPFQALRVVYHYEISKQTFGKTKPEDQTHSRETFTHYINKLRPRTPYTFTTEKVKLQQMKLDADWVWSGDDRSRQSKDKLKGITIKVMDPKDRMIGHAEL